MKLLLISAALAAASLASPAFAQQVTATPKAALPNARSEVSVENNVQRTDSGTVEIRRETIDYYADYPTVSAPTAAQLGAKIRTGKEPVADEAALAQLAKVSQEKLPYTQTIVTTTINPAG